MLKLKKTEAGFTLVEILIAVLLMSLVGLGLFTALAFSSKHTINSDVRATAESIARTEMEYLKDPITVAYDATNNPPQYTAKTMASLGMNSRWSITTAFSRLDPKGDGTSNDDGIQKLSVTVIYNGTAVLTVEGYKLN
jgi:prepilin-type N-terminal cleavage/methylation domain-containing protein